MIASPACGARMAAIETREPLFNTTHRARESGELYDELRFLLERTEEIRAKIYAAEAAVTLKSIPIDEIRALASSPELRIHREPDVNLEDADEARRERWYRGYILTRKHGGNDPNLWENRYRPVDFAIAARQSGFCMPYAGPIDFIRDPDTPYPDDLAEESATLAKRERGIMRRELHLARCESQHRANCEDTERLYAHLEGGGTLRTLSETMEVNIWRPHGW